MSIYSCHSLFIFTSLQIICEYYKYYDILKQTKWKITKKYKNIDFAAIG